VKHALLVALDKAFDESAPVFFRGHDYELTITDTVFDALAFVSERAFHLIVVTQSDRCAGFIWHAVDLISEQALGDPVVMVHAEEADETFHARAAELGAVVLSSPVGYVAVPPYLERVGLSGHASAPL
jgi:hypothetical protein